MAAIGFGIIGSGNIGPVHAEAIQHVRGAKLVGVAATSLASAEKLARQHNVDAYDDYRKMLGRSDLDVVCLCTPSGLRVDIVKACVAAGKHILSEKPLEVTTKRIDRMIEMTDKAGVLLGCIFQSRFANDTQLVRIAIDQGRFGKLVLGDAYIKWYRSAEYYASGAWRGTVKLDGGGALMNQGIHQIDLLQWFMGPVKRIQAQTTRRLHEGIEVEDLATAMLEFESGAMGVIEGSTAIWPGHPGRVEVHGTEGSAVLEDGKLSSWQFKKRKAIDKKIEADLSRESELGSMASDPMSGLNIEGHRRQIQDFVRAIRRGEKPIVAGREGRNAVEIIEKIYKSARTGRAVTL